MAITYDTQSVDGGTGVSSLTVSHTMSSAANGYLLAVICGQVATVTGVAWDPTGVNQAFTQIVSQVATSGGVQVEAWGLVNPASGTKNIVFSFGSAINCVGGGMSATGVHQTTPIITGHSNSDPSDGTDSTPTITCTSANLELAMSLIGYENGITNTPDGTWNVAWNNASFARRAAACYLASTGSSVSRTDTLSGATRSASVAVSLNPAASGSLISPALLNSALIGSRLIA